MRDFLRFLRYTLWYLVLGPARSGIAILTRPLFLLGATAVSFVLALTPGSPRAGEAYDTLQSIAPVGSLLGSTVFLWSAVAGLALAVLAITLAILAIAGLVRGVVTGAHLLAAAWKVPPLAPWQPTGKISEVVGCQVSDLHLCDGDTVPYELQESAALWRGCVPDGVEISARANAVIAAAMAVTSGPLFLTGDVTDRGDAGGWNQFEVLRRRWTSLGAWVVPGNHDIAFNPHDQPDYFFRRRAQRRARFEAATQKNSGSEAQPLDSRIGGAYVVKLSSVERQSDNLLSNAVGRFGTRQLRKVEAELLNVQGPILVLCHHHLGPIASRRFGFAELLMNALDAPRLIAVLSAYARRRSGNQVLVLHGHKHVRAWGRVASANVFIAGLPSSTLGEQDEKGRFDGKPVFARIGFDIEGHWDVELHHATYHANPPATVSRESHIAAIEA